MPVLPAPAVGRCLADPVAVTDGLHQWNKIITHVLCGFGFEKETVPPLACSAARIARIPLGAVPNNPLELCGEVAQCLAT